MWSRSGKTLLSWGWEDATAYLGGATAYLGGATAYLGSATAYLVGGNNQD